MHTGEYSIIKSNNILVKFKLFFTRLRFRKQKIMQDGSKANKLVSFFFFPFFFMFSRLCSQIEQRLQYLARQSYLIVLYIKEKKVRKTKEIYIKSYPN